MKNIIIIGGGGMGREIYNTILACIKNQNNVIIKGYLDDNIHSMDGYNGYPKVLSTIKDYRPDKDDEFVCSIGDIQAKKRCTEIILNKGGKFATLVHPNADVQKGAIVGAGTVIDEFAVVGTNAIIGDHCLIQIGSVVGHDVTVGNYTRIDCHVVCVGGTQIGNEVCIHTNSVINHGVRIGDGATVGAMSFVIRKVKEGVTVQGNPARIIEY